MRIMTGVDSIIIYSHNLKKLFQNQKSIAQYEKNLSRLMERERRQITKLNLMTKSLIPTS